jgi:hypothetical protein
MESSGLNSGTQVERKESLVNGQAGKGSHQGRESSKGCGGQCSVIPLVVPNYMHMY